MPLSLRRPDWTAELSVALGASSVSDENSVSDAKQESTQCRTRSTAEVKREFDEALVAVRKLDEYFGCVLSRCHFRPDL